MLKLDAPEQRKVDASLKQLAEEFADRFERAWIRELGELELERLVADARFPDFVPILLYRRTRERILARAGG
jgi:hypothetical protein